jgi:hypothetical protein
LKILTLCGIDSAENAAEPVFNFADPVAFQTFQSVFRTGLDDPALSNAIMLTFAFGVSGGSIDRECLVYQNQAMMFIRERLASQDNTASAAVLGAILLLAGVEVCTFSF